MKKISLLLVLTLVLSLLFGIAAFAESDSMETETAETEEAIDEETVTEEPEAEATGETAGETEEDGETEEATETEEAAAESTESEESEADTEEETATDEAGTESTETSSHGSTVDSGSCGDNVTWTLYSDGTLVISGTGAMKNYKSELENAESAGDIENILPWYTYASQVTSIVIESGVTSVSAYAFSSMTSVTSVTIASSVISIGAYAFSWCTALEKVTIAGSVTIGEGAFSYCMALQTVTISGSATIESQAFYFTPGLSSFTMNGGSVAAYAFWESGLTEETASLGGATVDAYAFYNPNVEFVSYDADTATIIFSAVDFTPDYVKVYLYDDENGENQVDELSYDDGDFTWVYDADTGLVTVTLSEAYLSSLEEGTYYIVVWIGFYVGSGYTEYGSDAGLCELVITADTEGTDETDTEDTDEAETVTQTDAAQTGDGGMMLWIMMLILAGAAAMRLSAEYKAKKR